jgi:hypothetical protein
VSGASAGAHDLQVSCALAEGGMLVGVTYTGGSPAPDARVRVRAESGATLFETTASDAGTARCPLPAAAFFDVDARHVGHVQRLRVERAALLRGAALHTAARGTPFRVGLGALALLSAAWLVRRLFGRRFSAWRRRPDRRAR